MPPTNVPLFFDREKSYEDYGCVDLEKSDDEHVSHSVSLYKIIKQNKSLLVLITQTAFYKPKGLTIIYPGGWTQN